MKYEYNVFIQPLGEDIQPRKMIFIGTFSGTSKKQVIAQLKSLPKGKRYTAINTQPGIIY